MRLIAKFILVGVIGLGGCVPVGRDTESGTSSLEGRAALMRGTHARVCDDVTLTRVNKSTSRIISVLRTAPDGFVSALDFRSVEMDPDYARDSRRVECDSSGHFVLTGLPAGRYYLIARLTWLLGHSLQGGFLIKPVDVVGYVRDIDMIVRHER